MPFTSAESRLAKLRPLDNRQAAEKALARPNNAPCIFERGFSLYFGDPVDRHPDGICTKDVIERISVEHPFPSRHKFYGFHIGMAFAAAAKQISSLGLRCDSTNAKQSCYSGMTPDSFNIALHFVAGDENASVDETRIAHITLSRVYPEGFLERRTALHQRLTDEIQSRTDRANAWKLITDDDDAMLMDWASHSKPWDDYSESEFVKFANWLKSAGPDERHMAAFLCNWDYGLAPLIWIVRQDDCDIATALYVFFGCDPAYHLEFEGDRSRVSHSIEAFDLMMEAKDRMENGFYERSEIYFDTQNDMRIIAKYKPTQRQLDAVLPKNIKPVYEGRRIDRENRFGGLRSPSFVID
ncbi:DUF4274 domain-containing protein [Sphingomonas sp. So64.6b]|uniref:DUF4274 domain-containing protein n=1 Tax=Sphingomonas sp. So64.6b TaxID=2997354 RepID=UPI0016040A6E|nr:DUF4274 domain-containing protein [Sphingomonas sp. So64.6b]QNA84960.1 DUF4274 domain-containing protein [Sphingomonas sp. So64.6b]